MNELVVLPLEVLGANYLDPPTQVSFKGVVRPLSKITHTPHFYLNYEDPLKMIIVS